MFEAYEGQDFEAWLIVGEDRSGDPAGQRECRRVQQENGLERVRVVYAPAAGALPAAGLGARHYHFVLIEGARVFHRRQFSDATFEGAIDQALALE